MKKIISVLLSVSAVIATLGIAAHAKDVNPFPPQRPEVGIMALDVDYNDVAAVRTNGTVNVNCGSYTDKACEAVANINNAIDVIMLDSFFAVLKYDGTVMTVNPVVWSSKPAVTEILDWTDVVDIAGGRDHLVGLKADGTVVATGNNEYGQTNVMGWNNISQIYAKDYCTVGIKKDGTLMLAGKLDKCINPLKKETDVKKIAINNSGCLYGGSYISYITLKSDGKISLLTEDNLYISTDKINEFLDENSIGSIRDISVTYDNIYILTEYGNLYCINTNKTLHSGNLTLLEENVYKLSNTENHSYFAIDNNGQILSNSLAFTSDDWILTTNITYNGKKIDSDVPPYVKDGRTLAPIRAILETLGMIVSWDENTQTATAVKSDITISVTINSNIAIVNGEQKTLDVPAEVTNGRTFVPVRFFAEALNMNVDWDAYTKTVIINSK